MLNVGDKVIWKDYDERHEATVIKLETQQCLLFIHTRGFQGHGGHPPNNGMPKVNRYWWVGRDDVRPNIPLTPFEQDVKAYIDREMKELNCG